MENSFDLGTSTAPADNLRFIVCAAWRRKLLLVMPLVVIIAALIVGWRLLPQTYIARTLMLLQETTGLAPFTKDTAPAYTSVQDRVAALRGLLLSDRVLDRVLDDLPVISETERQAAKKRLRTNLSLDILGNEFVELSLVGSQSAGLGTQLSIVLARFLEALVPDQGSASALSIIIRHREAAIALLAAEAQKLEDDRRALYGGISSSESRRHRFQDERVVLESKIARDRKTLRILLEGAVESGSPEKQDAVDGDPGPGLVAQHAAVSAAIETARTAVTTGEDRLKAVDASLAGIDADAARFRELDGSLASLTQRLSRERDELTQWRRREQSRDGMRPVGILRSPELIRVIDPPKDPQIATRPRLVFAAGSLVGALVLGAALALLAELIDGRLREGRSISAAAFAPILAHVGRGRYEAS